LWAEIQKAEPRAFTPAVPISEARKLLGPGTVFVSFTVRDNAGIVYAVDGSASSGVLTGLIDPNAFRDAKAAHDLAGWASSFWQRVSTPPPDPVGLTSSASALAREGQEWFNALFPGLIGALVRKSKRLIVSPDGPLWQLPLAALATDIAANGTPHYLGQRVGIAYAPSLSLYAQTVNEQRQWKPRAPLDAVVIGDPDFARSVELTPDDPEASRIWAGLYPHGSRPYPLEATIQEAKLIAEQYRVSPLTGDDATEAALRSRIERADIIHLATHAALKSGEPMASGLLLAPPEREKPKGDTNDDGALQAWEIFSQLKLRADLVVLSACDTARGDVVNGEGIVGLTRAFQYAGARSIVATQWSVAAGDSTARLMEEFHRRLREGKPKDEALREAMSVIRKSYPHPYYWAPFLLLGDPNNTYLGR